jgi:membrane protease YdiL (CAAX protease family)
VVGLLGAWLGGGLVGSFIAIGIGLDPTEEPVGLAITILSQTGAALWLVVWVSRRVGEGDLRRDVGLELRAADAKWILAGLALQIAVALVLSPLVRFLTDDFETQQQVAELAEATSDVGGRLILVVIFVVVAPFIEEVIFRGAMMSWLSRHVSIRSAVVISAAAFAAVHLADPNAALAVPSLFVIGIALGWAAQRRGSLSLPIFIHAGVNLLGAIVLMWGDDIVDYLERTQDQLESLVVMLGLG